MKKFFTLICAMICAVAANAASVDDIAVCRHSYVVNFAEATQNGAAKPGKGNIFADGYVLDVTGGSVATNKGEAFPAAITQVKDEDNNVIEEYFTHGEAFATKYADLAKIKNTFRLKNAQDVIAMKVTEGSKLIMLGQVHASRYPKFSEKADMSNPIALSVNETATRGYSEWVAPKDMTVYIGSEGSDWYIGYLIVEANEAPGTPSIKVGAQTYEGGLWFKEVTCKAATVNEEGETFGTVVTYTTDGSTPNASSPIYTEPIKVYAEAVVKFQGYYDWDGKGAAAKITEEDICAGADNEAPISFSFNAPSVACENGVVTVTSEYEGAKNMISVNGGEFEEASTKTLSESAIVTAKSVIVNGSYATFETMPASIDALVLTPITEEVTVNVTGTAVVDEEATATSTTGPVYMVQDGSLNINKAQFFDKGCQFKAIASADAKNAKYQVDGKEAYLMFGNDSRLYFEIGSEAADVEVICSKNSCKTLNEDEDETVTTDRKCFVNVSGTTYGWDNCTYKEDGKTVDTWTPAADIQTTINFKLEKGSYYFAKYSGTGNILISSIKITPAASDAIKNVTTTNAASKVVKAIENGQLVIKSAKGTFNVAGAQIK